jgi:hypothetical protein
VTLESFDWADAGIGAEDEGELVAGVRQHAWEAHGMALPDEALLLVFPSEPSETLPPRTPVREAAGGASEDES